MGRDALSINVIDDLSLADFDRDIHSWQYQDSIFLTPSKLLSNELLALPPTVWKVYNSNTTVGGGVCG